MLRTTNALLATILATYFNVNYRDANGDPLTRTVADFLPDPEAMDAEDEEDEEGDDVERAASDAAASIAAAINPLGAVATGHQLVMGSGAKLPDAALGAFFGANTEET